MDWKEASAITIGNEKSEGNKLPSESDKLLANDSLADLKAWREAAETALLKGRTEEALQMINRVIELGGRTIDLLTKAELLCATGDFEKCMVVTEENMERFESDLTAREKKNRLDSVIRKVADWLLKSVDALYADEQFEECAAFSQQVLLQHSVFLKMKKYRELFEFAWRSSYDAVLKKMYKEGAYEECVSGVNAALTDYRILTTFGQRSGYRKLRAKCYFRLKLYGKGMLDYFSLPGFQLTVVLLVMAGIGMNYALSLFGGQLPLQQTVNTIKPGENSAPAAVSPANPAQTPAVIPKNAIRRAEIKSLKLFEADNEIPAVGSRVYADKFSPQAKRIFVEVHYKNYNYKITNVTLPLIVRFYNVSGALLHEITTTSSPKKEYESAITSVGWRPEGGAWKPGKFVVRVALDGEKVEEVPFEIK